MSYSREIYDEAEKIIRGRRIAAESSVQQRRQEIYRKLPEVEEIERQLAQTSVELSRALLLHRGNVQEQIEKIRENNVQGQTMLTHILERNGYPSDYLTPRYRCAKCQDTGFLGGSRCGCFQDILGRLSVKKLNASSQMELCSFQTFRLDYYPVEDAAGINCRQKMQEIFLYCQEYARTFQIHSKSVFMLGMTGLGKTHLSLAIAKEVIEQGFNVAYDSIVNYLDRIEKEHFGRAEGKQDTLQILLDTDLLILDDFGSEFESSFHTSTLYQMINTRLNRNLPTIINCNLSLPELQKRYDDRIISRLVSMYDYLRFVGGDIRRLKRLNGEW